jgi:predicted TIM-barrel fold metal-dependent hydrolase
MTTTVISADSHVTEPPDTFTPRIAKKYRDQAPHIANDPERGDVFVVPGMKSTIAMGLVAAAGVPAENLSAFGARFSDLHLGGWDPVARMDDQARDGIDCEIIYPSVGMVICNHPDIDFQKACFDAYNLWIAEFCDSNPERLIGLGQTALRSVDEGIEDLERIKALGLRGVMMSGDPGTDFDFDDRRWDPFWQASIDLELPLSWHILTTRSSHPTRGPKMNSFLSIIRANQDIMGTLVLGGVFKRNPRLKVVCAEADAGWAAHFMYRMDHAFDRHRYWLKPGDDLDRTPSEYFREHVYMTFQDDWVAFKIAHLLNTKRLCWANDFPHSDSTWPTSQQLLAEHTAHLSDEDRTAILGGNIAELYGIGAPSGAS